MFDQTIHATLSSPSEGDPCPISGAAKEMRHAAALSHLYAVHTDSAVLCQWQYPSSLSVPISTAWRLR
jgi:hypothetical protein